MKLLIWYHNKNELFSTVNYLRNCPHIITSIDMPLVTFDYPPVTSSLSAQTYHLIALPDLCPAKLLKRWLSLILCLAASAAFSSGSSWPSGKYYWIRWRCCCYQNILHTFRIQKAYEGWLEFRAKDVYVGVRLPTNDLSTSAMNGFINKVCWFVDGINKRGHCWWGADWGKYKAGQLEYGLK